MGASHGDFVKYPRTPHLFGSTGTDDDKHMGERESARFAATTQGSEDCSAMVERRNEK